MPQTIEKYIQEDQEIQKLISNPGALLALQGDSKLKTTKSSPENIYKKSIFVHLVTYKHE